MAGIAATILFVLSIVVSGKVYNMIYANKIVFRPFEKRVVVWFFTFMALATIYGFFTGAVI